MNFTNKKESLLLFFGDMFFFVISLWLMLLIRYLEIPSNLLFLNHLIPFSIIFLIWIVVFFIAGLYEKHTLVLKNKLFSVLLNSHLINSAIAVLFFYFIPYFGITPKINLFIYLFISFIFLILWRLKFSKIFILAGKQKALLVGSGGEIEDLKNEVNNNFQYGLEFVSFSIFDEGENIDINNFLNIIKEKKIKLVVLGLEQKQLQEISSGLYSLIFSNIKFINVCDVYENIFNRIPLSLVDYSWFLKNITSTRITYDFFKRITDLVISFVLGFVSLFLYPFIFIAIKIEDKGPFFFKAKRVGKNGKVINLIKFRTMDVSSKGDGIENQPKITKVGSFLRKTRIDELPQLLNILKGELSLIGPRPETPKLVEEYNKEVSYYNIRHLIKPGLSGWAQMYQENHPHHGVDIKETRIKLSYDLYYLKNKSFFFDFKIILKTIKVLLSREGK